MADPEGQWKTVRAAIRGWGPTLRLITIMTAPTVATVAVLVLYQALWF
ncbi:hypothetical protein [Cryptosporangium arvum]|uniref:Uncharacterized protein n=1 Tax=Cryptosporangium arvum DSM 44712 TaxID=927661 RepID=A0A010Z028_9ACTN|nr:hypothetical protein [Cryptosporangium arvum]EXG80793.1 hypothetical protein CryarDRAFT_1885 [Cryptosporangium arvum DSM 44712]